MGGKKQMSDMMLLNIEVVTMFYPNCLSDSWEKVNSNVQTVSSCAQICMGVRHPLDGIYQQVSSAHYTEKRPLTAQLPITCSALRGKFPDKRHDINNISPSALLFVVATIASPHMSDGFDRPSWIHSESKTEMTSCKGH